MYRIACNRCATAIKSKSAHVEIDIECYHMAELIPTPLDRIVSDEFGDDEIHLCESCAHKLKEWLRIGED